MFPEKNMTGIVFLATSKILCIGFSLVVTEKTMIEARARKILGSSQLSWVVGGREMRVSLENVHAWV